MAEVDGPLAPTDWSYSDRSDFSQRWNRANVLNLLAGSVGASEYRTIPQRTAFYNWFDQIREVQGHRILWPAAAWVVASQMTNLESPAKMLSLRAMHALVSLSEAIDGFSYGCAFDASVDSLVAFGRAGNKAIFDDVFPRLSIVFKRGLNRDIIAGAEAEAWDRATLQNEQFAVVQPIYLKYASNDKPLQKLLAEMASGSGVFYVSTITCPDFQGDIMAPQDRFNHGINVVTSWYSKWKQAIDQTRARQGCKADPTAGGMVATAAS